MRIKFREIKERATVPARPGFRGYFLPVRLHQIPGGCQTGELPGNRVAAFPGIALPSRQENLHLFKAELVE